MEIIKAICVGILFSLFVIVLACWKVHDKFKQYDDEDKEE